MMLKCLLLSRLSQRTYSKFSKKHIGISDLEINKMLSIIKTDSLDKLIEKSTYIKKKTIHY